MRPIGCALKACRSGTQLPVPDLDFDPDLETVQETCEGKQHIIVAEQLQKSPGRSSSCSSKDSFKSAASRSGSSRSTSRTSSKSSRVSSNKSQSSWKSLGSEEHLRFKKPHSCSASEKTVEIPVDSMLPARRRSETMVVVESAIPCKLQTIDLEPVQVGDLVLLGNGVPQEYRSFPAIVTKVAESHCTVTVLDKSQQGGLGECWPGFQDVLVTSSAWRLGTRVVIEGMRSDRTKHLNGLTGIVSKHPRNGHPMFIMKSSCPNIPQLVLCIVFDDPEAARERSALLEPRFITPFDAAAEEIVRQLTETIACLPEEVRKLV